MCIFQPGYYTGCGIEGVKACSYVRNKLWYPCWLVSCVFVGPHALTPACTCGQSSLLLSMTTAEVLSYRCSHESLAEQLTDLGHTNYHAASATVTGESWHKYHFCRNPGLLSQHKFCCDKITLVAKNICCNKIFLYFYTGIHLLQQKTCFVATNNTFLL